MKAMILAAGRGKRMRPLTDTLPKPLLTVAGKPLIVYHIEKLAALGVTEIIINIAYLGECIRQALGDGQQWNVKIHYSQEPHALETAGALNYVLPVLGDEPFLLVNGDVWTDFDFTELMGKPLTSKKGRLVLVSNPDHNPQGDFGLSSGLLVPKYAMKNVTKGAAFELPPSDTSYTFSGIGLFSPSIIREYPECREVFPLKEVLDHAIAQQQLEGTIHDGEWWDIGTPERLSLLNQQLSAS